MRKISRITIFLTILLPIFFFRPSKAERGKAEAVLPVTGIASILQEDLDAAIDPGYLIESGGSLSSAVRRAYAQVDLPLQESTWIRLVRETIALNKEVIVNPDLVDLQNPTANRIEPGTVLTLPAITIVEEGDTGIGRVLVRLNPELKKNGRALLSAIEATIAANAGLIRNTDAGQLYDGRYNVIMVGDLLILPPEVRPHRVEQLPVQPPSTVAEVLPAARTEIAAQEIPPAALEQLAPVQVSESAAPETIAAPVTRAPAAVEAPEPVTAAAALDTELGPQQDGTLFIAGEPFPAIIAEPFQGPIGLTARETLVREVPAEKPGDDKGVRFLYAYLLAGLAFLGMLVIAITRWFERDREFRAQVNLVFTGIVFLATLGRVRRKPAVESTEPEEGQERLSPPPVTSR